MLVSVIITVFNIEKYVEAALLSALQQSYKEVEIIVVDDCSTDGSYEIIKKYMDQIRYIRTFANSGVLLATLEGIKQASGDVISFLDGDDLWAENKLELVVDAFKKHPQAFFLSHDYQFINSADTVIYKEDHSQDILKKGLIEQREDQVSEDMRRSVLGYYGNVWLGSAYCFRSHVIDKGALSAWIERLPDPRMTYQDHTIASYIFLHHPNGKLLYIPLPLFSYRIHGTNYSGTAASLSQMINVILKGLNTAQATHSLVIKYSKDASLKSRQEQKVKYFNYLLCLFKRKYIAALLLFATLCLKFWTWKEIGKELVRFGTIVLLGPSRYISIKNRLI
ncbi:MAG: glycosyltransferase [Cytophagaceae bacterium]|jgi:glycosyltransferase involved in cell wall biosynthesis|nr:glycosyltransferase [Cytophagaceae bacterium]